MLLSKKDFTKVVTLTPLVSIDFCIINHKKEMLFVERNCRPAKGFLFTPGGRIYKNESLQNAAKRISKEEIGIKINLDEMTPMGAWDHFYQDSAYDKDISTHYVNFPHFVELNEKKINQINVKFGYKHQHSGYEWLTIKEALDSKNVHKYSKIYAKYVLKKTIIK